MCSESSEFGCDGTRSGELDDMDGVVGIKSRPAKAYACPQALLRSLPMTCQSKNMTEGFSEALFDYDAFLRGLGRMSLSKSHARI